MEPMVSPERVAGWDSMGCGSQPHRIPVAAQPGRWVPRHSRGGGSPASSASPDPPGSKPHRIPVAAQPGRWVPPSYPSCFAAWGMGPTLVTPAAAGVQQIRTVFGVMRGLPRLVSSRHSRARLVSSRPRPGRRVPEERVRIGQKLSPPPSTFLPVWQCSDTLGA